MVPFVPFVDRLAINEITTMDTGVSTPLSFKASLVQMELLSSPMARMQVDSMMLGCFARVDWEKSWKTD